MHCDEILKVPNPQKENINRKQIIIVIMKIKKEMEIYIYIYIYIYICAPLTWKHLQDLMYSYNQNLEVNNECSFVR